MGGPSLPTRAMQILPEQAILKAVVGNSVSLQPSAFLEPRRATACTGAGVVFASGHAGPRKKSPPRTALRGGAGDLFFFTPPRAPSGAPFLLPPAKSPLRGPVFCGALSRAPLIVLNFVPEMRNLLAIAGPRTVPRRKRGPGWGTG